MSRSKDTQQLTFHNLTFQGDVDTALDNLSMSLEALADKAGIDRALLDGDYHEAFVRTEIHEVAAICSVLGLVPSWYFSASTKLD
jgi:hypothetical protein